MTYWECNNIIIILKKNLSCDHSNDDQFQIKRHFYEIPTHFTSRLFSSDETINGITQYYCILTLKKDLMYYRRYPYNCNEFMNYRRGQCIRLNISCRFHQHNFKLGVIHQLPVQPRVRSLQKQQ